MRKRQGRNSTRARQIWFGGDVVQGVQAYVEVEEGSRVDSPSAMLEFFLRSAEEVHRYVGRLTGGDVALTEDIVQETFIALLRHAREGTDVTMHDGWLMTAARCRFIDHLRSRHRESARVRRHLAGEMFESPDPDFGAVSTDQARWLLARLPVQERLALSLHTVEEYSVAEVAELIGRSLQATTSLLARARRRLRVLLLEAPDEW